MGASMSGPATVQDDILQALDVDCGLTILDPHQQGCPVVYCNPAFSKMTGHSTALPNCGLYGLGFLKGMHSSLDEFGAVQDAIMAGTPLQRVLSCYRKDGSMFRNLATVAPLGDIAGGTVLVLHKQISGNPDTPEGGAPGTPDRDGATWAPVAGSAGPGFTTVRRMSFGGVGVPVAVTEETIRVDTGAPPGAGAGAPMGTASDQDRAASEVVREADVFSLFGCAPRTGYRPPP